MFSFLSRWQWRQRPEGFGGGGIEGQPCVVNLVTWTAGDQEAEGRLGMANPGTSAVDPVIGGGLAGDDGGHFILKRKEQKRLLGSTIGSCWDRPSALLPIDHRLVC
jgi:hypothetical protein